MGQAPQNKELTAREVHFDRPPLIETATSVQFSPLPNLGNAMFGLLWNEHFRETYPKLEEAVPIEPQVERFGAGAPPRAQMMLRVGRPPAARLRMVSDDKHWMVQVQNGRLVFNWRELGMQDYPRWKKTLPRFRDAYAKLTQFVAEHRLGAIDPDQWEVTYANHFVRGKDWQTPQDWPTLVPGVFGRPSAAEGLRLESVAGTVHMEIEPRLGRLHVELEHAVRRSGDSDEEILVMQLTARGPVDSPEEESLFEGLNRGRLAIVDTFARFTGADAHKRWGKCDAG